MHAWGCLVTYFAFQNLEKKWLSWLNFSAWRSGHLPTLTVTDALKGNKPVPGSTGPPCILFIKTLQSICACGCCSISFAFQYLNRKWLDCYYLKVWPPTQSDCHRWTEGHQTCCRVHRSTLHPLKLCRPPVDSYACREYVVSLSDVTDSWLRISTTSSLPKLFEFLYSFKMIVEANASL